MANIPRSPSGYASNGVFSPSQEQSMVDDIIERVRRLDGHETEFVQAVDEVVESLRPVFLKDPKLIGVFKRLLEPERVISFRVAWLDDHGKEQVNRGWRVQYSSAIGPYKGGLRFHPSVTQGTVKFLGFEQVFKNSLTTLAMGGGKGGSDFDPKGKSDPEVQRFCQSFMQELQRHIGPDTDVPAGDIGVGGREIGFLFGMLKKLHSRYEAGSLTGKGLEYGGSLIRPEATGYGLVYFCQEMLRDLKGRTFKGMRCAVSGSGNVSQYCCEKLIEIGAMPVTMSDSAGTLFFKNGLTSTDLTTIMDLKNKKRGRLSEYECAALGVQYFPGKQPWEVVEAVDCALPCATQNEIGAEAAQMLVNKGCLLVGEGANMPTDSAGINVFKKNGVLYAPAKAANAGGVATSGLEMSQNSQRLSWSREEVDNRLQNIMKDIYASCKNAAVEYVQKDEDIQAGANIAGFLKVARAMQAQGCV